jgi:hypothetical protein
MQRSDLMDRIKLDRSNTSNLAPAAARACFSARGMSCSMPLFISPATVYEIAYQAAVIAARMDAMNQLRRFEAELN